MNQTSTDTGAKDPRRDCINCGAMVTGRFCATCGQPTAVERITWGWLVRQIPHAVFHMDRGVFRTLHGMLRSPGVTVRDYWAGQRLRTMNPLTFLALMVALSALNSILYASELESAWRQMMPSIRSETMTLAKLRFQYPLVSQLLNLPALALGSWSCFRSFGRTFGEHVIMNTFIVGTMLLIEVPIAWAFIAFSPNAAFAFTLVASVVTVAYISFVWIQVFRPFRAQTDSAVDFVVRCIGAVFVYFAAITVTDKFLIEPLIGLVTGA